MSELGGLFSTSRMLTEYAERFYLPALKNYEKVNRDDLEQTRRLSEYIHRLRQE
jgi:starch phosphorylase